MKRVWKVLGVAVAVVVVAGLALPLFNTSAARDAQMINLSRGKQLGIWVQHYAIEHEGRFLVCLGEMVPEFISPEVWSGLLYAHYQPSTKEAAKSQYDWLYFGALLDEKSEKILLIASPQALTDGRPNKRIVVYSDTSAQIVSEEQYQADLRHYLALVRASRPTQK